MNRDPKIGLQRRFGFALAALIGLVGCHATDDARTDTGTGQAEMIRLIERDIEAPEVFERTEPGLWDGRPSLAGVWVSHPNVANPERVIIRNEDNGRFVIGALFRGDRAGLGAAFALSADTATALGIAAGTPTLLQVTALRREGMADPAGTTTRPASTAADMAPLSPTATPATGPADATSAAPALDRAYVQIGIFSVQKNADNTARALRAAGLAPTVYAQESNGRGFWRVVVGPARSMADRAKMLAVVRGLGFHDAFVVAR
ncbi:MAG: hypothetical protein RLZZ491_1632 [Pseudomonadota bacterium]